MVRWLERPVLGALTDTDALTWGRVDYLSTRHHPA
jgi:hypothetical protein